MRTATAKCLSVVTEVSKEKSMGYHLVFTSLKVHQCDYEQSRLHTMRTGSGFYSISTENLYDEQWHEMEGEGYGGVPFPFCK